LVILAIVKAYHEGSDACLLTSENRWRSLKAQWTIALTAKHLEANAVLP